MKILLSVGCCVAVVFSSLRVDAQVYGPEEAKELLKKVNAAQMKLRPETRMLKIKSKGTISQLGMPNKTFECTTVGYQTATAYRADTLSGTLKIESLYGRPAREFTTPRQSMLWRAERKELRHVIEADHLNNIPATYSVLNTSNLDEQFQNLLAIPEIPAVLLDAKWTGYVAPDHGKETTALAMVEAVEVEPGVFSKYTLYVNPQSFIIEAIDSTILHKTEVKDPPKDLAKGALIQVLRSHQDVEQILMPKKQFDPGLFELEFPEGAAVKTLAADEVLKAATGRWLSR